MIRVRLSRCLLVVAASLIVSGPLWADAKPGQVPPPGHVPLDLFVKDKDGGFRLATPDEMILATESPVAHGSGKTSFIDIKRYDLGIYTLLVFGLLYAFIQLKVWPKVAEGLKKREASIEGAREEAQKDRQTALAQLADAKRQLDEAAGKAKTLLDDAHKLAESTATRAKEEAAKIAEAAREQSRKEIEDAREAAKQELYREAVQLASLLSAKTIRRELTPEDHSRLLDEALAELKTGVQRA